MDRGKVVRHDEPIAIEKPVCSICGADLDSKAVCMDRCVLKDRVDTKPATMRHG